MHFRGLFWGLVAAVGAVIFLLPNALSAQTDANHPSNFFSGPYADNELHTIALIETNDNDRAEIQLDLTQRIRHFDDRTIMDFRQVTGRSNSTDVVIWAVDQSQFSSTRIPADVRCVRRLSNGECAQFHMRINEDLLHTRSDQRQDHTLCHEFVHTLGSDDGSRATTGCFPQSQFSLSRNTSLNERDVINARDY